MHSMIAPQTSPPAVYAWRHARAVSLKTSYPKNAQAGGPNVAKAGGASATISAVICDTERCSVPGHLPSPVLCVPLVRGISVAPCNNPASLLPIKQHPLHVVSLLVPLQSCYQHACGPAVNLLLKQHTRFCT
jgi:hypothetical protein